MNKSVLLLFGALSLISLNASAIYIGGEPPFPPGPDLPEIPDQSAVRVNIGSIGGALDRAAIRTARAVVGHAVATGTADIFVVSNPNNGSIPVEGGISFCVEAAPHIASFQFNEFIDELRSIHPNEGTFYNVNAVDSCSVTIEPEEEEIYCSLDPSAFLPCPEIAFPKARE